jgi:hypothetical protein
MGRGENQEENLSLIQGPLRASEALAVSSWLAHDGVRVLQIDTTELPEDADGPIFRLYINDALVHGEKRRFDDSHSTDMPLEEKAIFVEAPGDIKETHNLSDALSALADEGITIYLCGSCGLVEGEIPEARICRRCSRAVSAVEVKVKSV